MRIQLIEHDPEDFSHTNISKWIAERGYQVNQTFICSNEKLPPVDSFDWLMVMGGSPHAWDEKSIPWLTEEKDFLNDALNAGKIVLGICFGAQLLAQALGGKIFPAKHKEIGWHEISLKPEGRKSFLFKDIPDAFVTFHWHSDHFSLPRECTRLAYSEPTENQAFICPGRRVVGLQFHPEYTRQMVTYYAREHSQDWISSDYVFTKDDVLGQTDAIPDTYWLMENLLNNMEQEFAANI